MWGSLYSSSVTVSLLLARRIIQVQTYQIRNLYMKLLISESQCKNVKTVRSQVISACRCHSNCNLTLHASAKFVFKWIYLHTPNPWLYDQIRLILLLALSHFLCVCVGRGQLGRITKWPNKDTQKQYDCCSKHHTNYIVCESLPPGATDIMRS